MATILTRAPSVGEERQDPTGKLISLQGKRFLLVVFDGATLDTARWELSSPARLVIDFRQQ